MLEEAAGTRMYESKRAAAQKTIEKKDSKLKEIDAVSVQWSGSFVSAIDGECALDAD